MGGGGIGHFATMCYKGGGGVKKCPILCYVIFEWSLRPLQSSTEVGAPLNGHNITEKSMLGHSKKKTCFSSPRASQKLCFEDFFYFFFCKI